MQSQQKKVRRAPVRGFSLLEIMIVITLIGLVTAAVGVAVMGQLEKGQIDTARNTAYEVGRSCDIYKLQNGSYPKDVQSLVTPPRGKPIMEQLPTDPWGGTYTITTPGVHNPGKVDVVSPGPDKEAGTADDVGNWPEGTNEAAKK